MLSKGRGPATLAIAHRDAFELDRAAIAFLPIRPDRNDVIGDQQRRTMRCLLWRTLQRDGPQQIAVLVDATEAMPNRTIPPSHDGRSIGEHVECPVLAIHMSPTARKQREHDDKNADHLLARNPVASSVLMSTPHAARVFESTRFINIEAALCICASVNFAPCSVSR